MTGLSGAVADLDTARLSAAKLWLLATPLGRPGARVGVDCGDLPYLAEALYALVPVPCAEVTTVSADEYWRLYLNPDWLALTPVPVVAAAVAHEVGHLLRDHAGRARDLGIEPAGRRAWHLATEACVNEGIAALDLSAEEPLLTPQTLGLSPRRSAEEYYAALPHDGCADCAAPQHPDECCDDQPDDAGCGSAADGQPRPWELAPQQEDFPAIRTTDAERIRHRVAIEFREHVSTVGTQPGDWERWASAILEPIIPWQQVLSCSVRRAAGWANGRFDYTYARPSRRQASMPGIVLPGLRRPLPNVAIVVDTSGSVDDGLLAQAMGEVDGALRGVGVSGGAVTVLSCDAAVHTVGTVSSARQVRLAGGGGTDMGVGLRAAQRLRPHCDVIVVLTDGYTPWPPLPPAGSVVVTGLIGRDRDRLPPTPGWMVRVECVP